MELVPGTLETSKEAKQWNRHMKWEKRFDSEEGTMSRAGIIAEIKIMR
jgi:hypothetical protein